MQGSELKKKKKKREREIEMMYSLNWKLDTPRKSKMATAIAQIQYKTRSRKGNKGTDAKDSRK
jgi:hypothetical protein